MQESTYRSQLASKKIKLTQLLKPFFRRSIDVFESPQSHYRMRAEFRIWHDNDDSYHIMFDPVTKQKYRVDQFEAASELINQAMKVVIGCVLQSQVLRTKLYQVDYLSTLSHQLLVTLIYRKPIDESWEPEAIRLKHQLNKLAESNIIGRARKQKILLDKDFVEEHLFVDNTDFTFVQVENSFTQPNAVVNKKMIQWACDISKGIGGDLLELYCGAGNFSIPLSKYYSELLGTEISKTSVAAAQKNIRQNNVKNLKIAKLSSEEFCQAFIHKKQFRRLADISLEKYNFSTVLVDPPRAGLDDLTIELVAKFDNIIYISCNPETLAVNLQRLSVTHEVKKVALFDQFPYSSHIESGVQLCKRK